MRQQYRIYSVEKIASICIISMAEQEIVFRILDTIIYRAQRVQSIPKIMLKFVKIRELFVKKDVPYNLRTKELCRLPSAQAHRYRQNCLSFRGSLLWNTLDYELKRAGTLREILKGGSQNGMAKNVIV